MGGTSFHIDLLAGVLDAASLRQRVIAQNVANINTPHYRRMSVSFEDDLGKVLARGGDVRAVRPQIVTASGDAERDDGNSVDVDREMAHLTQNSLLYAAASQILTNRLATLRSAISGR